MRVFLGFDGGGTKTECAVLDENNRVLGTAKSGASNPTRVGFENAANAVQDTAALALADAHALQSDVVALCAGLAGTARPENRARMRELLVQAFPGTVVHILTDLELALAAMKDGPAIVLVAGTGSAAIGRDAHGNVARAGGYGRDVSDEGSAYDVGCIAIEEAIRERTRTGEDSFLGRQILRQLACRDWTEVQDKIAADRDAVYPRVFPVVVAAAEAADDAARNLLTDSAGTLATLVKSLAEQLNLGAQAFDLATTGGMMGRSSFFDGVLMKCLQAAVPHARTAGLIFPPAEAAARIALQFAQKTQRSAE